MATRTARTPRNGESSSLASAMTMLLQNQARCVSHLDEDRQRFAHIERDMAEIKMLLLQHDQILKHHDQSLVRLEEGFKGLRGQLEDLKVQLKNLPEAVRKKIGFDRS
jgi:chromosome segregation ATPase